MSESGEWQRSDAGLRTPPQDVEAEQSVLGGMLLSKDAIADVIEVLRPEDFYKPAHETIHSAILDLYAKGEPADAVTVAAALMKSGDLARIGGAAYLHTLIASVPTAANAGYYARIVGETALLRKLVEAAPASCRWASTRKATRRSWSTARRRRSTRSRNGARRRTTRLWASSSTASSTTSRS